MEFSDREIWMFRQLGLQYLTYIGINPVSAYQIAIEKVFLSDRELDSDAVECLRHTYRAVQKSRPSRLTKEFDDLITC